VSRWDETWHRLREWTNGQGQSERLAAQILLADGFSEIRPSHPLGGRDGGKDALAIKDGRQWIMAVYFPRGQQTFSVIRKKFFMDHQGAAANDAFGMAFVTNQELTVTERAELSDAVQAPVELYDVERMTALLDQPLMHGVRAQFLGISDVESSIADLLQAQSRLEGLQTGGDTYCYIMLYHFDMQAGVAQNFVVIRKGDFPLYDVRIRMLDMDESVDVLNTRWGELNSPADYSILQWPLRSLAYYRMFFHARNGSWTQDLQLRKSVEDECWLAATRVRARDGEIRFEHMDSNYVDRFGQPEWRQ
jgi:hypothetical protein